MDNPRPEKVAVVDDVRGRFDASSGAILTEYRGLKVSELAELRRALRAAGGDYKIYKNTLVRFAVSHLGIEELDGMLTGPTAIAFVDGDAAAVAKALRDFARANPNLVIKGGLLGGSILSPEGTAALADLPSREVLLARLAGGLAAPLQKLAGLLQALPRNFAYGLSALIDQKGGPEAAAASAPAESAAADAEAPAESAQADAPPESAAADAEAPAESAQADAPSESAAADAEGPAESAQADAPAESAPADETAIEAAEAAAPRADEISDGPSAAEGGAEAEAPAAETTPASEDADQTEQ